MADEKGLEHNPKQVLDAWVHGMLVGIFAGRMEAGKLTAPAHTRPAAPSPGPDSAP